MHLFQHFSRRRIGSSVHSQGTNHSLGPGRCGFSCSGSEGPGGHTRGTLVTLRTAANGAGTGVRKPSPVALRRAGSWHRLCSREPHRIRPSLGFSDATSLLQVLPSLFHVPCFLPGSSCRRSPPQKPLAQECLPRGLLPGKTIKDASLS